TGQYAITGLQAGNYFARTTNSAGYLDRLYDAIACATDCTVTSGTPITMTNGGTALANFQLADNTPQGTNVSVQPRDATLGALPATVTFAGVLTGGRTTLASSGTGVAMADGYQLGTPPLYLKLTTTAVVAQPINVCVSFASSTVSNAARVRL